MSRETHVHPTSLIGKNVQLGEAVTIGAYCTIGSFDVTDKENGFTITIGEDSYIGSHTVISDNISVEIGRNVIIGSSCVIGCLHIRNQDRDARVVIGDNANINHHVIIYENVTINEGVKIDPFVRVGPHAKVGAESRLLFGARIHEQVIIGEYCSIGSNCPDRSTFGDYVIHLGRIVHSFYYPFANWDEPEEPGPVIGSHVVIAGHALIIGPARIGNNVFILPKEIVRQDIPDDGIFKDGRWHSMPNWSTYLRIFGRLQWTSTGSRG